MDRAAQILRDNREFYRACAPAYDAGREYSFRREGVRVRADLEWLNAHLALDKATVLDIGCGTGFYSLMAATLGVREVHCLDIDPVFLKAASEKVLSAYPQVQLHCHEGDLESFARTRAELLLDTDIYIMGSVLQYVPGYQAILQEMASRVQCGGFYITSTRLPGNGRHRLVDGFLARLDYALHRLIHPRSRGQRSLPATKVTLEVDPEGLKQLFEKHGFATKFYSYSAFHTLAIDSVHRWLRAMFPALGTHFTLLAVKMSTGDIPSKKR